MTDSSRRSNGIAPLTPGAHLGGFQLLERLGQGAQGTVFAAWQQSLDRKVALKILSPEAAVDEVRLARFRREIESAQRIQHDSVARVHSIEQAGGWHYLVEELVEGESLKEYTERWGQIESRHEDYYTRVAELMAQTAEALAAAHSQGVVHRDVKPSNILLTAEGRPKVVDFGVAAVRGAESLTGSGDFVGTPAYASPEHLFSDRGPIDERSDIFSLGCVMYELLTGRRAFQGQTTAQIIDRVALYEPPPAHDSIAGVPTALSIICGKAMDKQRSARFVSMDELAADLRRFLAETPIRARPPGQLRLLLTWVRHHPAVATGAVAGLIALVMLGVMTALISAERDRTKVRQAEVETALTFIRDAYETIDPRGDASAAEVLQKTAQLASVQFAESPGVQVRLLIMFGEMHRKWAQYERAESLLVQARDLSTESFGPDNERTLHASVRLEDVRHQLALRADDREGALDEVAQRASEIASHARRALGHRDAVTLDALSVLGQVKRDQDRYLDAERLLRESYDGYLRATGFGPDSWEATTAANVLGRFYLINMVELEKAEPLITAAVDFARARGSATDHRTGYRVVALARLRKEQGRYTEAEELYREGLHALQASLGENHPDTITTLRNLGILLGRMGQEWKEPDRTDDAVDRLYEAYQRSLARGDDLGEVRKTLLSYANMLRKQTSFEEAFRRFEELRERSRAAAPDLYWLEAHYGAARCLQALGRDTEAAPLADEAVRSAVAIEASAAVLRRCHALLDELNP